MHNFLMKAYYALTAPFAVFFILSSMKVHPSYKMNFFRKLNLGMRMFLNKTRVQTGTNFKAHLAMALKLLEMQPEKEGVVVECGTWKGGSACNLSLICEIVNRKLIIFDSFAGLPLSDEFDREAPVYTEGEYCGTLEEVKSNLRKYGAIKQCEFRQGWFEDTLPKIDFPIVLAFLDVDLESSLDTCIKNLWNHLVDEGFVFTDEAANPTYITLFFSEKWWAKNFNRVPPGLIGAGTGLPLGEYYIGPMDELSIHPLQHASTGAYTRKNMEAIWVYYPEEQINKANF
ncbi:MAG: class I SAM-dependent methyltransferase [Acidobacteria bacterium]|jgi:hypothetical protein|nr:class I SAM-dependent methyltransferase [Acidobacteriota bacterium]